MKILYAGDSPVGGPANYLLGGLRHLGAKTTHVAPSQTLKPQSFNRRAMFAPIRPTPTNPIRSAIVDPKVIKF